MGKFRGILDRVRKLEQSKNRPSDFQLVTGIVHGDLTVTPIDEWEAMTEEEQEALSEKHSRKQGS
ncbi:hypothetical protein ACFL0S_03910 [Thermodesulfobacteriota bacterium]